MENRSFKILRYSTKLLLHNSFIIYSLLCRRLTLVKFSRNSYRDIRLREYTMDYYVTPLVPIK